MHKRVICAHAGVSHVTFVRMRTSAGPRHAPISAHECRTQTADTKMYMPLSRTAQSYRPPALPFHLP